MVQKERVTIPLVRGQAMPAYFARPDGDAPAPGLLVVHEIVGLNDDIRGITERFAENGYAALAPNVFANRGVMPVCVVRTIAALQRGRGPAVDDLLAARDWLAAQPGVDESRIGVVGFCMGGGFALLLGSIGDFQVAGDYYGDVPKNPERLRSLCPVFAGYGLDDKVFGGKAQLLEDHLQALGIPHQVEVYEHVGHSYMNRHALWMVKLSPLTPLRARYDETAAEDSWSKMLDFFAEYLGADAAY